MNHVYDMARLSEDIQVEINFLFLCFDLDVRKLEFSSCVILHLIHFEQFCLMSINWTFWYFIKHLIPEVQTGNDFDKRWRAKKKKMEGGFEYPPFCLVCLTFSPADCNHHKQAVFVLPARLCNSTQNLPSTCHFLHSCEDQSDGQDSGEGVRQILGTIKHHVPAQRQRSLKGKIPFFIFYSFV